MCTAVRASHFSNALPPMVVTLLGIVIEVRAHPEKAPSPMVVTPLGIVEFLQPIINVFELVSIKALQLSRLS
jgi:hypothetical protein